MPQTVDAERMQSCLAGGGVVLFPADTVYGLGCDPLQPAAIARLYELKGRPQARASAVMFFALAPALQALPELLAAERAALAALMPGPVTLLLANRGRRFAAACAPDPGTIGLRVPRLEGEPAALAAVGVPVLQSSANASGAPDARRLADIDESLREGVDLVLDGGDLPGVASTVIDLRDWATIGGVRIVREGALSRESVMRALATARSDA